jgi:hypothetical protein
MAPIKGIAVKQVKKSLIHNNTKGMQSRAKVQKLVIQMNNEF